MEQCVAMEDKYNKEILPLHSPSSWSYDALTRSLNINNNNENNENHENTNSFYKNANNGSSNSIISLLNECEFSPLPNDNENNIDNNNIDDSSYESMATASDMDITYITDITDIDISLSNKLKIVNINKKINYGAVKNSTQMMAGLVLLCISGILDAGSIAYVNWLDGVGFNMEEILMYQGIVQIILCFFFGIITIKVMTQHNSISNNDKGIKRIHRNISFRSLVLPFSMEYNVNFVNLFKTNAPKKKHKFNPAIPLNHSSMQQYKNKYGAMSDFSNISNISESSNCNKKKQLIIAIISFGIIQFASHLTYFIGYLNDSTSINHFEIAPLFNSLAIVLAFLWSYCIFYHSNHITSSLNSEVLLYLFLMYIGVFICGYSFIKYNTIINFGLILRISNIYLIASAFFESLGYVLIKFASNIPTFILVFSQSVFCGILGLILFETSNESFVALNSFSDVIEMSSVGLIGFSSTWSFVRGTQLISIGTASFFKMTFFIIFSIVIQVFSIDAKIPHFYCVFGLCLLSLSIVLMLIEKFSKFSK